MLPAQQCSAPQPQQRCPGLQQNSARRCKLPTSRPMPHSGRSKLCVASGDADWASAAAAAAAPGDWIYVLLGGYHPTVSYILLWQASQPLLGPTCCVTHTMPCILVSLALFRLPTPPAPPAPCPPLLLQPTPDNIKQRADSMHKAASDLRFLASWAFVASSVVMAILFIGTTFGLLPCKAVGGFLAFINMRGLYVDCMSFLSARNYLQQGKLLLLQGRWVKQHNEVLAAGIAIVVAMTAMGPYWAGFVNAKVIRPRYIGMAAGLCR